VDGMIARVKAAHSSAEITAKIAVLWIAEDGTANGQMLLVAKDGELHPAPFSFFFFLVPRYRSAFHAIN
jgi:hypothetical protein